MVALAAGGWADELRRGSDPAETPGDHCNRVAQVDTGSGPGTSVAASFANSWSYAKLEVPLWAGSQVWHSRAVSLPTLRDYYSIAEFSSLIAREGDRIELKTGVSGKPLQ